jgi:hypothetical protein
MMRSIQLVELRLGRHCDQWKCCWIASTDEHCSLEDFHLGIDFCEGGTVMVDDII